MIIRHGQSEGNAAKILQGRGEYPLSERGRLEAASRGRALNAALAGTVPERTLFFSSPQGRARETARIIASQLFAPRQYSEPRLTDPQTAALQTPAGKTAPPEPVYLDDLAEMSLGIWTGKSWGEVKNDDPALWTAFMARSWDAIPEAEPSAALYDRALRLWAALRDAAIKRGAENVIVVTHGGLIQWLLKCTFHCRSWFPLFPISNCGLFRLCVKPNPAEKSAYLCWEEINAPLPDRNAAPQGFPS